jgi:hypothetical protein
LTNCRAINESETIIRTNFEQFADFTQTFLDTPALRFQAVACFKKWVDETVVLETSADPSLIVASCDSRVILQSQIRRLIPDFCRSTSASLALAISVLPPILRRFPELPLPQIQLAASVLGVVKCRTFSAGTLPQDGVDGLLLVSAMRHVFVKNQG